MQIAALGPWLGLLLLCAAGCNTPAATPSTPYPPAFMDFMMHDWSAPVAHLPEAEARTAQHRARRALLSAAVRGEAVVIPNGAAKTRSADQNYPFRPGSDFYYLTGNPEPGAVLLLLPEGDGHSEWLFVAPRRDHTDARFITDRANGVLWVGQRYGVAESQARYGVDHTASLEDLPEHVRTLARGAVPFHVLRHLDPEVDALLPATHGSAAQEQALQATLATLRLRKDAGEVAALQEACDITARGFADVLQALPQARSERALASVFTARASGEGNDNGYLPVVAAGSHATILHWSHSAEPLPRQGLLLLDLGAESLDLYSADITRTLPLSGHFTETQRELYEAVLAAQQAGIDAVQPGAAYLEPHRAAMRVLTDYLVQRKILHASAAAALDPNQAFYKRYTLHATSHMLGLDVHDCGAAPDAILKNGQLQPGMVLTVEPGLYFQADDLTVPEALRGLGVRIEDDVLVTESGHRLLSNLPRSAAAVEAWMQAPMATH